MTQGTVHPVEDAALGNNSYLVVCGDGVAVSVDPRRDAHDHLRIADSFGARIVAVLETHLHADFLSGSREIASATDAQIVHARAAGIAFEHRAVDPGDEVRFGDVTFRALAAAGHTLEHLAYVADGVGLFSGGALIVGGIARTDLAGDERTKELTRAAFRTLRSFAALPDDLALYPTHGAGSFCSAGASGERTSTLGEERRNNELLRIDDEATFLARFLDGLGSFPPYFLELPSLNRSGPRLLYDITPPRPLSPQEAAHDVARGARLIDTRPVERWSAAHPKGSIYIRAEDAFATWLGWALPFDAPFVVVADESDLDTVTTLSRRIGYEHFGGWVDGGIEAWHDAGLPVRSIPLVDADDVERALAGGATLLDVRQWAEWDRGHARGARHVELGDVVAGGGPAGEVITYCKAGERSSTAASVLAGRGARVSVLRGGITAWRDAGLPVER